MIRKAMDAKLEAGEGPVTPTLPSRDQGEPPFKVRDTAAWMTHVADLEAEMIKRSMVFEIIAWDRSIDSII
jgi:hypothetical protein